VEEQHINETRQVLVGAALKSQVQRFHQLAEEGLIESPLSVTLSDAMLSLLVTP